MINVNSTAPRIIKIIPLGYTEYCAWTVISSGQNRQNINLNIIELERADLAIFINVTNNFTKKLNQTYSG